MRKRKTKIETSKLLLRVLFMLLGIVFIPMVIYTFLAHDSAPLVTYIDGIIKLSTIAVGFYYWKAKNENLHKYKRDDKIGEQNE